MLALTVVHMNHLSRVRSGEVQPLTIGVGQQGPYVGTILHQGIHWGCIGILEKNMETTIVCQGVGFWDLGICPEYFLQI